MYEEKEQCLNRIVIIKMKKACDKPSSLLFNVVEKDPASVPLHKPNFPIGEMKCYKKNMCLFI